MNKSKIVARYITRQYLQMSGFEHVAGAWVTEFDACIGIHPRGCIASLPSLGDGDDITFTAPDGRRYSDLPERTTIFNV